MWRTRTDCKGFITPVGSFMKTFCHSTGFFPNDKQKMIRFAKLMREVTQDIDFMALRTSPMGEYEAVTHGRKELQFCHIGDIEPILADNAWSAHLKGKKVLVIHPFDKSIPAQYAKRELLFPGKDILGASVQLLFGIRGARWESSPELRPMLANPAWVRPAESERPEGFKTVEDGAYW